MKLNISNILPSRSSGSMKIGTKIFALVGFCLGLLVVVSGVSVWQMNKIGVEIEGIAERDLPLTEALTGITIHQLEQAINFERAFRTAEVMEKHHEAKAEFEKAVRTFEELSAKVEKEFKAAALIAKHAYNTAVTQEGRDEFQNVLNTLDKLGKEHADYDHLSIKAFQLIHAGNLEQAMTMIPKIEAEEEDLDHGLEKILLKVESFTAHAAKAAEAHEQSALMLLLAISGIALVLGIGFAVILVKRSVTRPLDEIIAGLEALNADDLTIEVKVYNDDEIGAVAKAYAVFKDTMIKTREMEAEKERERRAREKESQRVGLVSQKFRLLDSNIGHQGDRTWHHDTEWNFAGKRYV